MRTFNTSTLSLLFVIIFSLGCVDDDPSPDDLGGFFDPPGNSSLSCEINGQQTDFQELFIGGTSTYSSGVYAKAVTGILVADNDTTHIIMSISYLNDTSFVVGNEFEHDGGPLTDFAFGYYGYNTSTSEGIESYSTEMGTATLLITDIDEVEETWSATFEFTAPDEGTGAIQTISNGEFTDIDY